MKELQKNLVQIEAELSQQDQQLASYQQIMASQATIEEGFTRLETARQANEDLAERVSRPADLDKELNKRARQVDGERAKLQSETDVYRNRIADAEKIIAAAESVAGDLAEIDGQLQQLAQRATERDEFQEKIKALSEENAGLVARNESLDSE